MSRLVEELPKGKKYDCLLVDDEADLSLATCEYFAMFGVSIFWVEDAESSIRFLEQNSTDLVLLDINLIGASGFDACKRMRQTTNIPILFISARQSDDDRLLAFSIGGDDYIQKPYSLSVLLAKVKAVLSRYRAQNLQDSAQNVYEIGNLILSMRESTARHNGVNMDLKPMEFKLLVCLVKNSGRTIPKDELYKKVWNESVSSENTLNVHIRRLREKLELHGISPQSIKTVWGIGYAFNYQTDTE